ncbi:MAG: HD-GYP domain-containing protein [Desulfovibrionaceae bacterium]|nr:HD-GYP domain-containing protein [Desulfovibrionaceae bacterium]
MIKEIPVEDLRSGMYVVDTGLTWVEKPFLYSREGVLRGRAADNVRRLGYRSAFIDTEKGPKAEQVESRVAIEEAIAESLEREKALIRGALKFRKRPRLDLAELSRARKRVPLDQEMEAARKVYTESLQFARDIVKDVRMGRQVKYEEAAPLVENVIESVMRNEDALMSMKQLRAYDEYTYTHSINVAVISAVFGKFLGLSPEDLLDVARAALFHDVGKARIPEPIINKPGRLTDEEFSKVKAHPTEGFNIIKAQARVSEHVLRGVLEHHEKHNGKGYPRGLTGAQISTAARIIGVADVYDALTSRRVYKEPMTSNKALKIMYGLGGRDFYPLHVERFIKCLGIYPVGSLVRLASGECGVVVGANPDQPLRPRIKIILNKDLLPKTPHVIDLAAIESTGRKIVECLDHMEMGIDPAKYLP